MDQPSQSSRTLSVVAFPRGWSPYAEIFNASLEAAGVRVADGVFSGRWLWEKLPDFQVVHFHWPSYCYYKAPDTWLNWARLVKFGVALLALRIAGKKIAWTAHNLYPHDGGALRVHRAGRWLLRVLAHRVFVHGASAQDTVVRQLGIDRGKTVLIEQGNYVGYYSNTCSRAEARMRLGLPADATVFCFVGQCRPYKNLEHLIASFQSLEGSAHLLIAGKFLTDEYRAGIEALIAKRPERIHLHGRFIRDDEMQLFLNAGDCMVLPYSEILTSGAAMLALSFGLPVIAPLIGSLPELVSPECGMLYERNDPEGLSGCLERFDAARFDREHIVEQAERFSWERSAATFVRSFDSRLARCGSVATGSLP